MLSLVMVVFGIISVYGDNRNFSPTDPEMDHHKNRVWVWLHPKCFSTEIDVRQFKDFLLSQYKCIDFNEERKKIYKHPTINGDNVWSLWLEKNIYDYSDFECLNKNVSLPNNLSSQCIVNVYYEPLQHIAECKSQPTAPSPEFAGNLWSLDEMDGITNNLYQYFEFDEHSPRIIEAIILDTDVDNNHVEFSELESENLFLGTPAPTTSQDHGTHVTGTVVGHNVGGAKKTNFYWYPVCQLGSSCAWSDIEDGYETAIEKMQENPTTIYVINYSVGGSKNAINEPAYNNWGLQIQNSGNFWVTSAGNSASDACDFAPAFSNYAIAVGSYSAGREPTTWFTNYGTCVDAWGPGNSVFSANPGDGYGYSSGTSMASPNICALVINLLKEDPSLTLSLIKEYLKNPQTSFPLNNAPVYMLNPRGAFWPRCT